MGIEKLFILDIPSLTEFEQPAQQRRVRKVHFPFRRENQETRPRRPTRNLRLLLARTQEAPTRPVPPKRSILTQKSVKKKLKRGILPFMDAISALFV